MYTLSLKIGFEARWLDAVVASLHLRAGLLPDRLVHLGFQPVEQDEEEDHASHDEDDALAVAQLLDDVTAERHKFNASATINLRDDIGYVRAALVETRQDEEELLELRWPDATIGRLQPLVVQVCFRLGGCGVVQFVGRWTRCFRIVGLKTVT